MTKNGGMMNEHRVNRPPHPVEYQSTATEVIGACLVVAGIFAAFLLPVFEISNWITRKLLRKGEKHG